MSPLEIVQYCREIGLGTIAITDHDSVLAMDQLANGSDKGIEVIPAVELSSNIGVIDIHILAYYIDHGNADLLSYLETLREHRVMRARTIVERLSRAGIDLDFEQMKEHAKNSALGRPHIAVALLERGYVQSTREAFVRFLSYHSPYYEPKMSVDPGELLKKIESWGGISVIAHPGIYGDKEFIQHLIDAGAAGIEVWHPDHSIACQQEMREIAGREHVLMTGGSDCHGHHHANLQIGKCGCGQREVELLRDHISGRRGDPAGFQGAG
ncbi:hypothetical protein IBX73_06655 [candidate division WOR-3 bacterium]|nr:hypothetical protein [candidate division WOR-3 bacterium]